MRFGSRSRMRLPRSEESPGALKGRLRAWLFACPMTPACRRLAWHASAHQASAQSQAPASGLPGVDPAQIEDLVVGSRIIAGLGVLDAFGHVSMRDPRNPGHFHDVALARARPRDGGRHHGIRRGRQPRRCARGRAVFLERFIHGRRSTRRGPMLDVGRAYAISPGVILFGVTKTKLKPMYHNSAFLGAGAPVFDIRPEFGTTDMLVRNKEIGKALAQALGDQQVVLMRGHGDVTVGPSVRVAVFRAYYTDVDARLEAQALGLGGEVNFLTPEEAAKADLVQSPGARPRLRTSGGCASCRRSGNRRQKEP